MADDEIPSGLSEEGAFTLDEVRSLWFSGSEPQTQPDITIRAGDEAALLESLAETMVDTRADSGSQSGSRGSYSVTLPGGSVTIRLNRMVRRKKGADAPHETDSGDYEMGNEVGKGGMGIVYAARQSSLDRRVAVKMMLPEQGGRAGSRDKFILEALTTGALDHPNVVPVYELGVNEDDKLFYSMKEVRGSEWRSALKNKSERENLEILVQVANAVASAHAKGIVHRDLKTENVMLGDYGEVMVMDWGLAVAVTPDAKAFSLRDENACAGTPAYMAPEMARGLTRDIGPWSDQYLLGGILFEILTGKPPHGGSSSMECLLNAANNVMRPHNRDDELMQVALRAMRYNPMERYPSVSRFIAAVRDCQAHAESVELSRKGSEWLSRANGEKGYDSYGRAVFALEQAVEMWPQNAAAKDEMRHAIYAYAKRAHANGDHELAISLAPRFDDAEMRTLRDRAVAARAEQETRRRRIRMLGIAALVLLALTAVVASGSAIIVSRQAKAERLAREEAEQQRQRAEEALTEAEAQRLRAESALVETERQRNIAERERGVAEEQRGIAVRRQTEAEQQRQRAEEALTEAEAQRLRAESALVETEKQRNIAERERGVAEEQRGIAVRRQTEAEQQRQRAEEALTEAEAQRLRAESALVETEKQRTIAERERGVAEEQRGIAVRRQTEAEQQRQRAEEALTEAEAQRLRAESALVETERQRNIAERERGVAEEQRGIAVRRQTEAEQQRQRAEEALTEAEAQRLRAESALVETERQRNIAERERGVAEEQRGIAVRRQTEAEQQRQRAEEALTEAEAQRLRAESALVETEKQRTIAERERGVAEEQRGIAVRRQTEAEQQRALAETRRQEAEAALRQAEESRRAERVAQVARLREEEAKVRAQTAARVAAEDALAARERVQRMGYLEDNTRWRMEPEEARKLAAAMDDPVAVEISFAPGVSMRMQLIPPGSFVMGSPPREPIRSSEEHLHEVTITSPYYVAATELTRGQWRAVMGVEEPRSLDVPEAQFDAVRWRFLPLEPGEENLPATGISHRDATDLFLPRAAATAPAGFTLRLPTEAEWEWAARAGAVTAFASGEGESALDMDGWFEGNSFGRLRPVGQKAANVWGIFDVSGNAQEMVADGYDPNYYLTAGRDDPFSSPDGPMRVARGGSFVSMLRQCRLAARSHVHAENRHRQVGLRLAMARRK